MDNESPPPSNRCRNMRGEHEGLGLVIPLPTENQPSIPEKAKSASPPKSCSSSASNPAAHLEHAYSVFPEQPTSTHMVSFATSRRESFVSDRGPGRNVAHSHNYPWTDQQAADHLGLWQKENGLIISICSSAVFVMYLGVSIPVPFLPETAESYGASLIEVGVLFAVFPIASSLLVPVAGWLCTRMGRIAVLFLGMVIMGAAMIWFGLSESLAMLFAARVVQGIGGALTVVAATAIITHEFRHMIGEAMAVREIFSGVAFVFGPTIGGLLYDVGGFELPFLVIGGLKLLLATPFAWTLSLMIRKRHERLAVGYRNTLPKSTDSGVNEISPNWPASELSSQKLEWTDRVAVSPSAGVDERRSIANENRLTMSEIFNVTALLGAGGLSMAYVQFSFAEPQLQAHFDRTLGLSPGTVGLLYALAAFAYAITAFFIGKLTRTNDCKVLLCIGVALGAVTMIFLPPVPGIVYPASWMKWLFSLIGVIVLGTGGGMMITTGYVILEGSIPVKPGQPEACSALFTAAEGITSGIAPIVGGLLVEYMPKVSDNCIYSPPDFDEEMSPEAYNKKCESGFPWTCVVVGCFFALYALALVLFLPSQRHLISSEKAEGNGLLQADFAASEQDRTVVAPVEADNVVLQIHQDARQANKTTSLEDENSHFRTNPSTTQVKVNSSSSL